MKLEAMFLTTLLPLAALLLLLLSLARRRQSLQRLPSPPKLPIIGNLHQLGSLPHRSLRRLSLKYGPLMLLHFGSTPVLVASTASIVKAIIRNNDRVFSDRPPSVSADRLMYGSKDVAFSPYGEYWRQARRVCTLHLLSPQRVRLARAVREEEVGEMIENIRRTSPGTVNLSKAVMEMTGNVICRVALGGKWDIGEAAGIDVKEMLEEFLVLLGRSEIGEHVPWLRFLDKLSGLKGRMEKNARQIDRLLEAVIEHHARRRRGTDASGGEESFVDVLMKILEEEQGDNLGDVFLDRDSMKAIILDMFAAGTHTTFVAIDWAMAEMAKNPEVMRRAREEAKEMGRGKRMILEEDVAAGSSYIGMVVREALRLHPPVPLLVPRLCSEDVELNGHRVPRGTRLVINAWAVARDPGEWDAAEEFMPERFAGAGGGRPVWDLSGADGFRLVPFGSGRRGCPGAQFAVFLIELALANLLYGFEWEIPGGGDLDMDEAPGIAVARNRDLVLIAKPII